MTVQITVRIPDDLVQFIDAQVASGAAASRATAVATALRHERRHQAAERDIAIYAATEPDAEMQALASWANANIPPIGDEL